MFTVAAFCFQTWLLRVQDLTSGLLAQHLTACSGYCSTPAHNSTPALSIWRSHLQTQAGVYKPHAQAWDGTLLTRLLHWTITCSTYFQRPLVCAFCGVFKLGAAADQTTSSRSPPSGNTPPYAVANAFLAQFTVTTGSWNHCDSCKSTARPHTPYAVFMSPSYQRSLLNCSAFQQQFLSVLDCRGDIARRYHGFAHGHYISESLLEHPLIAWNDTTECVENCAFLTQAVEPVLQVLMQNDSVIQRHLTMLEVPSMTHGFPMLSSSSIATIISRPIAQPPIQSMYTDPLKSLISTITAMNVTVTPASLRIATTSCGTLRPHDQPTLLKPLVMQPKNQLGASLVPSPVSFQHRCMGRCYLHLFLLTHELQSALLCFHLVQELLAADVPCPPSTCVVQKLLKYYVAA